MFIKTKYLPEHNIRVITIPIIIVIIMLAV